MKKNYPVHSYLSYTLASAHRKIHSSLASRLKKLGFQVEAWRVMEILDAEVNLTMGDLAEAVLMNPPTLTKLVDRMVADGIVHRKIAHDDHRQVNLVLTQLGRKRVHQIREEVQLKDAEILHALGDEKAKVLHDILAQIEKIQ